MCLVALHLYITVHGPRHESDKAIKENTQRFGVVQLTSGSLFGTRQRIGKYATKLGFAAHPGFYTLRNSITFEAIGYEVDEVE